MKNDPFAIMRRIGSLCDDYQTCTDNGILSEELKNDLSRFCIDFDITEKEVLQIVRNELTISEIVLILSRSK